MLYKVITVVNTYYQIHLTHHDPPRKQTDRGRPNRPLEITLING